MVLAHIAPPDSLERTAGNAAAASGGTNGTRSPLTGKGTRIFRDILYHRILMYTLYLVESFFKRVDPRKVYQIPNPVAAQLQPGMCAR